LRPRLVLLRLPPAPPLLQIAVLLGRQLLLRTRSEGCQAVYPPPCRPQPCAQTAILTTGIRALCPLSFGASGARRLLTSIIHSLPFQRPVCRIEPFINRLPGGHTHSFDRRGLCNCPVESRNKPFVSSSARFHSSYLPIPGGPVTVVTSGRPAGDGGGVSRSACLPT
jgi:hypothetical protein